MRNILAWLLILAAAFGCDDSQSRSEKLSSGSGFENFSDRSESLDLSGEIISEEVSSGLFQKKPEYIYVDSVPSGANVYILTETKNLDENNAGKTPFKIKKSDCKSLKFWISFRMEDYIKKVEKLPGLEEWVADFKTSQHFGGGYYSSEFDFDTSSTMHVMEPGTDRLIAMGPVYELSWPLCNRLCALFIPDRVKPSVFYSLMPSKGTHNVMGEDWQEQLVKKYKMTHEQAEEAMGCLERCGKFVVRVKNPFKSGMSMEYSLTVQGPELDIMIMSSMEVRD